MTHKLQKRDPRSLAQKMAHDYHIGINPGDMYHQHAQELGISAKTLRNSTPIALIRKEVYKLYGPKRKTVSALNP